MEQFDWVINLHFPGSFQRLAEANAINLLRKDIETSQTYTSHVYKTSISSTSI